MSRAPRTTLAVLAVMLTAAAATSRPSPGVRKGGGASGILRSGKVWHDMAGNIIDAHGAGLLEHNGTFYWYVSCCTCMRLHIRHTSWWWVVVGGVRAARAEAVPLHYWAACHPALNPAGALEPSRC